MMTHLQSGYSWASDSLVFESIQEEVMQLVDVLVELLVDFLDASFNLDDFVN